MAFFFLFFFSYFEPAVLPVFVLDQPPFLLCVGSALFGKMNANRDVRCGIFLHLKTLEESFSGLTSAPGEERCMTDVFALKTRSGCG